MYLFPCSSYCCSEKKNSDMTVTMKGNRNMGSEMPI